MSKKSNDSNLDYIERMHETSVRAQGQLEKHRFPFSWWQSQKEKNRKTGDWVRTMRTDSSAVAQRCERRRLTECSTFRRDGTAFYGQWGWGYCTSTEYQLYDIMYFWHNILLPWLFWTHTSYVYLCYDFLIFLKVNLLLKNIYVGPFLFLLMWLSQHINLVAN